MEVLSDSEWDDFDRFVETLGPLYVAEEEIVFGAKTYQSILNT